MIAIIYISYGFYALCGIVYLILVYLRERDIREWEKKDEK